MAPLFLTVALVGVVSACGNGDGDAEVDATVPTPVAPQVSESVEPQIVQLDAVVHFAGFEITVEEAALEPAEQGLFGGSPTVTVTGAAENLGTSAAQIRPFIYLDVGGRVSPLQAGRSELGQIAAGSRADIELVFEVVEDFELADGVLRFGGDGIVAATVPLDGDAEPVPLDPVDLALTGTAEAGDLVLSVTSGEARFDRTDLHEQAEDGKAFVIVSFGVTFNGEAGGPSYPFGEDETRLRTPDGAELAPIEFPIELLRPGTTTNDLTLIFEIDNDEPGGYALVVVHVPGLPTETMAELPFEVPALASGA